MSVAFWSIALTNKASKEVEIPEGYVLNVQQAALTGAAKGSQVIKVSTLAIDGDKLESVIGTLRAGTVDQTTVSLVFGYDVPVTFSTTGDANGTVYLSGYFQPGPDGDSDEEGDEYGDFDDEEGDSEDEEEGSEEDDEEEDDQEGNAKNALAAIKKLANAKKIDLKSNSKGKVEELNDESVSDDEDSSEDEDDSEDEKDEAFIKKMNAKLSSGKMDASDSEEDDSEEDDSEEEEEDSESESEDEAPPMKVQKTAPKGTVTPSGKQQQQQQKPSTPAAKPSTPAAKAFGGDNNKPKTPQQAPQSANKPNNNNNNNNNKTPQNKPNNNNNNNNNQKSGNKFPQSGDKRKHG